MLIKPVKRSGPLTIWRHRRRHIDLQPTILDLIGLPGGSAEESMFRRDPRRPRTRTFGMYDLRQRFPKEYFTRLDVLAMDGPIVDAAGWRLERVIWRPDVRIDAREIDIGTRSGDAYVGPGWSVQQRESGGQSGNVTFVRALTRQAVLFASLPAGASDVLLRVASSTNRAPRSVRVRR